MRAITAERVNRALYSLWWVSIPLAGGAIVALLIITLRWVLTGGIRNFQVGAFLPWLAAGVGLALWLVVPAAHHLATAPADDERGRRLTSAWQQVVQEFVEWLALPLELAYAVARWGGLLILAGFSAWLLLAGSDPGPDALSRLAPVAIRFALFLLLYLIVTTAAAVLVGLWTLLSNRGTPPAPAEDTVAVGQDAAGEEA
ncbi:MAG: hypothetical protein ACE5IZ_05200 [Dehalococcoidia bacterium]